MAGITDQQIYDMVMQSQFWSNEQVAHYQRSQVSQLLRHAKAHVPFYQNRLDCMFRSDGTIDWQRWQDIPILTRENMQHDRDAMIATQLPAGHGKTGNSKTSGSTGHRVEVTATELMHYVANAKWRRYFEAQNIPANLRIANFDFLQEIADPKIDFQLNRLESNALWQPMITIRRSASPRRKLDILKQHDIEAIIDFSNAAEILARENADRGFGLRLKYILGYGMGFTQSQRTLIAESFGAASSAPYSSKEGALMAYPCGHGVELHVCTESCILEILDDNNQPCKVGQRGHITITNIFNAAQPIIRYRHGDLASFVETCACGRTSPRISEIQGRSDPIFQFPDRELTLIGVYLNDFTDDFGASAFQLAQIGPVNIEMRYMSNAKVSLAKQKQLTAKLRTRIHPDLIMTYRRVPDIPYNANGKQQRYVREWTPP